MQDKVIALIVAAAIGVGLTAWGITSLFNKGNTVDSKANAGISKIESQWSTLK